MTSRVLPGAEPFSFEGGQAGVLIVHGFTGNPSGLRPLGEWLSSKGFSVACPRLPGHGTRWQDLASVQWTEWFDEARRSLEVLSRACPAGVIAVGVSMGGGLSLLLGARHAELLRGVVAVNPYVKDRRLAAIPLGRLVIPSVKGIGNDIAKTGQDEQPYERIPTAGLVQLGRLLKTVQRELPGMRVPLLVMNSPHDHVVPKGNASYVMDRAGSTEKELVELSRSYHVAWLDHDAETIFGRIEAFARAHTSGGSGG